MAKQRFDYVIAGGGTAGSVLAARLSENPNTTVLMVEAGPRYRGLSVQVPAAVGELYRQGRYHWDYVSAAEPYCNNRTLPYKLGKVLGGASTINGLVWMRGHRSDFDAWQSQGCTGWGWSELEPVFRRIESFDDPTDAYMGHRGPIQVTCGNTTAHELNDAFLQAVKQAGFPLSSNLNGAEQEGFGYIHRNTATGRRCDVYAGYLQKACERQNLTIVTDAHVSRLCSEGRQITGIEYYQSGHLVKVNAAREVLLCAGALGSPQLLMLSGIGPADILSELDIDLVHELVGVGQQLQTHPTVKLTFSCRQALSLLRWTQPPGRWLAGLQWLLTKKGPASSNHFETGGFIRSHSALNRPDLQLTFVPLALGELYSKSDQHGFEVYVVLVGGQSCGWTRPVTADSRDAPAFCFNFLQRRSDSQAMLTGCGVARKIVAQRAFADILGEETSPGQQTDLTEEWLRENLSVTHHLAGTCRMGPASDKRAVVGPDLCVHGLQGLRVVDASIMPRVTSANTHAAVIMIAEHAADKIQAE